MAGFSPYRPPWGRLDGGSGYYDIYNFFTTYICAFAASPGLSSFFSSLFGDISLYLLIFCIRLYLAFPFPVFGYHAGLYSYSNPHLVCILSKLWGFVTWPDREFLSLGWYYGTDLGFKKKPPMQGFILLTTYTS